MSGKQGGNVTILADAGQIAVAGSIKANSTDASNAGGNIVIGRDTSTGVLAANTNVSGATLEAVGGFVETSGSILKSVGVSVKAAKWLLDPVDVEINDTVVPLVQGHSVVLATDIAAAITNGTDVLITTSAGSGGVANSVTGTAPTTGNIIYNSALGINPFSLTGLNTASLTLSADNSITFAAGSGRINLIAGNLYLVTKGGNVDTTQGSMVTYGSIGIETNGGNAKIGDFGAKCALLIDTSGGSINFINAQSGVANGQIAVGGSITTGNIAPGDITIGLPSIGNIASSLASSIGTGVLSVYGGNVYYVHRLG